MSLHGVPNLVVVKAEAWTPVSASAAWASAKFNLNNIPTQGANVAADIVHNHITRIKLLSARIYSYTLWYVSCPS